MSKRYTIEIQELRYKSPEWLDNFNDGELHRIEVDDIETFLDIVKATTDFKMLMLFDHLIDRPVRVCCIMFDASGKKIINYVSTETVY
jgi:hypothetical protein